ncbi:MAG TPA: LysM peptidoglycan-binding domain-containing protein [Polyangiaceae bacterium]
MRSKIALISAGFLALTISHDAHAFMHIVKPGESLAQIAQRVYGDPKLETVLAGANALDSEGGSAPVAGMRLEVPAPKYHHVAAGETWPALSTVWLGDAKRADVLARANHGVSWIAPEEGREIVIPYVLTVIANESDRMDQIAKRYLGDPNRAWELDAYNSRKPTGNGQTKPLVRGEIILVPLVDLALTDAGKTEAKGGGEATRDEGAGATLDVQRRAESELPLLQADVAAGRYVEAAGRGNRILGSGEVTKSQQALVYRALLDAYVALDSAQAAAGACAAWRAIEPKKKLDPVSVSPKIRAACPTK